MNDRTYGVILAGGGGTRLWPASRRQRPKQFLPLVPGGQTLLQATVERLRAVIPLERILVVTAADQVAHIARAVPELPAENILAEPEARNTAPCIGLAALEVERRAGGEALLAVVPSDQYVSNQTSYAAALTAALAAAGRGLVATIGIPPTRPETGFGYIEVGAQEQAGASLVARFVEKPDRARAAEYLASGRHLWNSGMFFFRAERMLRAVREHMPELSAILEQLRADPSRAAALYPTAPAISIDYGIIERLAPGEVAVVPGDFGWNDVGSWSALHDLGGRDAAGNVGHGETVAVDASGNVLYSSEGQLVAAIGVHDLVIVATGDAVLVVPRERAQDVKEIVKHLQTKDPSRL